MKNLLLIILLMFPVFTEGQIIETIAGTGVSGYSGDGHLATLAEFNDPWAVKIRGGNIYIADGENYAVRKINNAGIITTIAGNGNDGHTGDGGPATDAKLRQVGDLVFDTVGNLYISEFGSIQKVTDGIITTIAGTGALGESGDNGPATDAQVYDPIGLVFDNAGNLYFSDNGMYLIRKINTTGIITTIAGTGHIGYSGEGGPATLAQVDYVGYMAIGPDGDLYIPDYGHWVRKINLVTGIITTVVGNGTNSYTGDGGPASAAGLMSPIAVTFDQSGNMYISDNVANVVRKVNTSGIISTVAGNGMNGFSGDGGPATNAAFNNYFLNCSAVDAYGNMFIADPGNNRIREVFVTPEAVNTVVSSQNVISIFPNPAKDEVTIKSNDKIETVEVVNIVGQVVAPPSLSQGEEVLLNVAHLPSGVYFVKVNGVYGGKFVKE